VPHMASSWRQKVGGSPRERGAAASRPKRGCQNGRLPVALRPWLASWARGDLARRICPLGAKLLFEGMRPAWAPRLFPLGDFAARATNRNDWALIFAGRFHRILRPGRRLWHVWPPNPAPDGCAIVPFRLDCVPSKNGFAPRVIPLRGKPCLAARDRRRPTHTQETNQDRISQPGPKGRQGDPGFCPPFCVSGGFLPRPQEDPSPLCWENGLAAYRASSVRDVNFTGLLNRAWVVYWPCALW
jgi:hypothetical protein